MLDELAPKVVALASTPPDPRRNRTAYQGLRQFVDPSVVAQIQAAPTPEAEARLLRSSLGGYLTGRYSNEKKAGVATWIVSNWGSITQGTHKLPNWINEFGSFDPVSVDAFRSKVVHNWISSWSKIIAFADHRTYPIYDTNNAVALNVLMEPISTENFFYVPTGRNMFADAAGKKLVRKHKPGRGKYADLGGYEDYRYLMERVVQLGKLSDVLAAEQLLFTRSIGIAKSYLTIAEQEQARQEARDRAERNRSAQQKKKNAGAALEG